MDNFLPKLAWAGTLNLGQTSQSWISTNFEIIQLNSSTIDELREGAKKDGGATT